MKRLLIYLTLSLVVVTITSCEFLSGSNANMLRSSDTLLTKTITFPNKLLKLEDVEFYNIDSFLVESSNKTKIISIIDATCMKCIVGQLNKLDESFNSITSDDDELVFILNVNKTDSASFMRNLHPAIISNATLLWDNAYHFELQNKLLTYDANLRTFMVNKENKIIQYGNPIMNPDLLSKYKDKLEAHE